MFNKENQNTIICSNLLYHFLTFPSPKNPPHR